MGVVSSGRAIRLREMVVRNADTLYWVGVEGSKGSERLEEGKGWRKSRSRKWRLLVFQVGSLVVPFVFPIPFPLPFPLPFAFPLMSVRAVWIALGRAFLALAFAFAFWIFSPFVRGFFFFSSSSLSRGMISGVSEDKVLRKRGGE